MAKKAKRLVSESRTQLIECCRLLHIALFRRALAHFPQSPDLTAPASQRSYSSYARHPRRTLDAILWPAGRYEPALNFVRGRLCPHHRLARPFIR